MLGEAGGEIRSCPRLEMDICKVRHLVQGVGVLCTEGEKRPRRHAQCRPVRCPTMACSARSTSNVVDIDPPNGNGSDLIKELEGLFCKSFGVVPIKIIQSQIRTTLPKLATINPSTRSKVEAQALSYPAHDNVPVK